MLSSSDFICENYCKGGQMTNYQICTRCVMDNKSDNSIRFNEKGVCNYCIDALYIKGRRYYPNDEGEKKLEKLIERLKEEGKNKKYDCMMGLSGGLDSSYLAYLGAEKWGLRIAAVHIDDGFDTEISTSNIEKLCKAANIHLITIQPDPTQYNDLTRSFIRAGVPNIAIPQDNILFACLYRFARDNSVHNFLSGDNFALESILQRSNTFRAYDLVNTKAIHKQFGEGPIDKLPLLSQLKKDIDHKLFKIRTITPLDYIDYNRDRAFQELEEFCGFRYYGSKHLENTLTKVIQLYYFPRKFAVEKRRSHLSSMIISEQITREDALEKLAMPLYDEQEMENDIEFVLSKLKLSRKEFEELLKQEPRQHNYYKTSLYIKLKAFYFKVGSKIKQIFRKLRIK